MNTKDRGSPRPMLFICGGHQKTTTLHQRTSTLHQRTTTLHQRTTTLHQRTITLHQRTMMLHHRTSTLHQRTVMLHHRTSTLHQRTITLDQRTSTLHQRTSVCLKNCNLTSKNHTFRLGMSDIIGLPILLADIGIKINKKNCTDLYLPRQASKNKFLFNLLSKVCILLC